MIFIYILYLLIVSINDFHLEVTESNIITPAFKKRGLLWS
jgi:hypothetical protein